MHYTERGVGEMARSYQYENLQTRRRRFAACLHLCARLETAGMTASWQRTLSKACATLTEGDAQLGRWMNTVGPCGLRVQPLRSLTQALAESILYQQLNGKAAATIYQRVLALFGGRFPSAQKLLACSDEKIRACGVSGAKCAGLKSLADHVVRRKLPSVAALANMSDAAIVEQISAVRGIGPWTVEMLLIFRLGRLDVWPTTDYGVRKGFAKIYGGDLPAPKMLATRGAAWSPYRSVVAWYMWRAAESNGGRA